jgi:ferredoxin--NADP+ reductase
MSSSDSGSGTLNAVVVQRQDLGERQMILGIAPDGWTLPRFEAGQFATVGIPAEFPRAAGCRPEREPAKQGALIKRALSIASAPEASAALEFYLALVDDGNFTARLWALHHGARVWLGPKISGGFTLRRVAPGRHLILIAAGTGLAPFISMLRSRFDPQRPERTLLIHGARHARELGYRAELMALAQRHPTFAYLPVLSRPRDEPTPWVGSVGYVQQIWATGAVERRWGESPAPESTDVFLCGSPAMVDGMSELLRQQGFSEYHARGNPAGQIHVERYW